MCVYEIRPATAATARIAAPRVGSRFGRTYAGEPDKIADELAADEAVLAADSVLFTVPNQLGVEYNARILDTIARHIAPAIGWRPAGAATAS